MFCCCAARGHDAASIKGANAMYIQELDTFFQKRVPLIRPVESMVLERHCGPRLSAGVAEMCGWRSTMEDTHCCVMKDTWGFFGVFDGHEGDNCSNFVAAEIQNKLELRGCPADDASVRELLFEIDQAFLDSNSPGGSTGAMCIVQSTESALDGCELRVINAGDSRVLLGRWDGSIIDGGGSDQALTKDHKPDHPVEWERIHRCGGTVVWKGKHGFRLNGDLAVSRGFGGAAYKKSGGPGLEDRPFTVDPQLERADCGPTDFIVLVTDGVYERGLRSSEVVRIAAEQLRETHDPASAAAAVCQRAMQTRSKDNVTCMIIMTKGGGNVGMDIEFMPGPLAAFTNDGFMSAWASMAARAGLSVGAALEQRYELVQCMLENGDYSGKQADKETLEQEVLLIGRPPGQRGDEERSRWFQSRFKRHEVLLSSRSSILKA